MREESFGDCMRIEHFYKMNHRYSKEETSEPEYNNLSTSGFVFHFSII